MAFFGGGNKAAAAAKPAAQTAQRQQPTQQTQASSRQRTPEEEHAALVEAAFGDGTYERVEVKENDRGSNQKDGTYWIRVDRIKLFKSQNVKKGKPIMVAIEKTVIGCLDPMGNPHPNRTGEKVAFLYNVGRDNQVEQLKRYLCKVLDTNPKEATFEQVKLATHPSQPLAGTVVEERVTTRPWGDPNPDGSVKLWTYCDAARAVPAAELLALREGDPETAERFWPGDMIERMIEAEASVEENPEGDGGE